MPELTSPRMTATWSRSISLRVFCTPVPTSLAEASTRSWTWRPRTPPFLLISASAYLAPSTSLCASAASTPVRGLTIPILIGSSASDLTMKGAPITWLAPTAMPDLMSVRRLTQILVATSTSRSFCFLERYLITPEPIAAASADLRETKSDNAEFLLLCGIEAQPPSLHRRDAATARGAPTRARLAYFLKATNGQLV